MNIRRENSALGLREDFVELTAVAEMSGLRLRPTTEVTDGEELERLELAAVFGHRAGADRPIIIRADDVLTGRGVEEFEIGIRQIQRPMLLRIAVDHRH